MELLNRSSTVLAVAVLGILTPTALAALAAPVQWPVSSGGNGHYYEIILAPVGGIDWSSAQAAAVSSGGYLATLTSAAENDFVYNNLVNNATFWTPNEAPFQNQLIGPWIGGLQPVGSAEPSGGWEWVNGDGTFASTYSNWDTSEPNNFGTGEDRTIFFNNDNGSTPAPIINAWNDVVSTVLAPSYVIETIPEPSTLLIFGLGFAALSFSRRKL